MQNVYALAEIGSGFEVVKCKECAITCLHPIPSNEDLEKFYKKYYLTIEREEREFELVNLYSSVLDYLIKHSTKNGSLYILDYGFGSGNFLKAIAKTEHKAFGADLSAQNCFQAKSYSERNNLALSILNLSEESLAAFGKIKFDVITMFQVIEHLRNPAECLRELSSFQCSGSLIYVECPNNDALYLKIKDTVNSVIKRKGYYESLKAPEHIFGFNKYSMTRIFKDAGYEIIDIGDYYYSDGLHQVESVYWWPPFYQNKSICSPIGFVKSLIQAFDMLFSKLFNAGGGLYVLARKQ
jgi:2-polyprenyl-3-methyl-5-hydroxy-6-metoxy-1,4-benzoquinol methylase